MAQIVSSQAPTSEQVPETVPNSDPISERPVASDVAYSVFTVPQKKAIVLSAALGATFSPISTTIYLPALNQIAADLHVSSSKINLTVTTFLVSMGAFRPHVMNVDDCIDSTRSRTNVDSGFL